MYSRYEVTFLQVGPSGKIDSRFLTHAGYFDCQRKKFQIIKKNRGLLVGFFASWNPCLDFRSRPGLHFTCFLLIRYPKITASALAFCPGGQPQLYHISISPYLYCTFRAGHLRFSSLLNVYYSICCSKKICHIHNFKSLLYLKIHSTQLTQCLTIFQTWNRFSVKEMFSTRHINNLKKFLYLLQEQALWFTVIF